MIPVPFQLSVRLASLAAVLLAAGPGVLTAMTESAQNVVLATNPLWIRGTLCAQAWPRVSI